MVMFVCDICGTKFKTTQHLNQHKNRKKPCVKADSVTNNIDESISIDEIGLYEGKYNITYNDIVIFLNTYKNIQSFINDKEFVLKSKNEIIELRKENLKLKKQLEIIKNILKNDFSKQPSSQYIVPFYETTEKKCQDTDVDTDVDSVVDYNKKISTVNKVSPDFDDL